MDQRSIGSVTPGRPELVRAAAQSVGSTTNPAAETGVSTQPAKKADPILGSAQRADAVTAEPVSVGVSKQIQALQAAKSRRTPAQQKMDSQLIDGEKMRRGEPLAEGMTTLRVELEKDDEDRVLTDIDAKVSHELLQRIAALGGKVVSHFAQFNAIRARLPLGPDRDPGGARRCEVHSPRGQGGHQCRQRHFGR